MVYNWLRDIQHKLATHLFPGRCVLCADTAPSSTLLCRDCAAELPANRPACPRCARPLPVQACPPGAPAPLCGECLQQAPVFDRAISAWQYAGAIPHLVTTLKFHRGLHLVPTLATGLLAAVRAAPRQDWPEVIVPIPLHPVRLRERGFNQAMELARPLGRALGLPIAPTLCRRTRSTAVQSTLTLRERKANVRGAFVLDAPCPWHRVAILDDVLTTGHTVAELSRVLKRAGVDEIEIWSVARAVVRR